MMIEHDVAKNRLAEIVMSLAFEKKGTLDRLKEEYRQLKRPDFIWYFLLQSFSTMGNSRGWDGLIGNQNNYKK